MTTVGRIAFGRPTKHWDAIARRYVEGAPDDLPATTFGPLGDYCVEVAERHEKAPNYGLPIGPGPSAYLRGPHGRAYPAGAPANTNTPRADRKAAYITTYRGRFYPFAPTPEDVNIEDIAHSLAMQCRYAGHGRRFYSVAEHCVHIARWLEPMGRDVALAGLLHDATEAYLVDVPRPIKAHLPGYKEAEAAIWLVIADAFDLDRVLPTVVHVVDSRIIADEMAQNLHEVDPNYTDPLGVRLEFWSPDIAKMYFLDSFRKLSGVANRWAA